MLVRFIYRAGRWTGSLALLVLLLAAPSTLLAQDVIIDLSGNELSGQVLEITPTQVVYRTPDTDPALPPSVLDKRTLFMIRFANGTKEVFSTATAPAVVGEESSPAGAPTGAAADRLIVADIGPDGLTLVQREQFRERGRQDAFRYYNRTGPFLGSMFGTLGAGMLPAILIACIKPRAHKNRLLDPKLLAYPSYVEGYEHKARKRKLWPAVGGFLCGAVMYSFLTAGANP